MRRLWLAEADNDNDNRGGGGWGLGGPSGRVWGGLALEEAPVAAEAVLVCPIRFQGQWADAETGLVYNRFRYYDPLAGQYASPDPIGLLGGFRGQGYVVQPTGWIDPRGLACCPLPVKKAVNSNMPHAVDRGLERGVFSSAEDAKLQLNSLSGSIKNNSWPDGSFLDPSYTDRVLVPVGNNGLASYQVGANGTAKLKTVLIAR